ELAKSTALGALATGTGETAIVGGLKYSLNIEVWKEDAEMTDATHESASQEKSYEQVIEDAYVTLTSTQKTKVPVTAIPKTSNVHVTTISLIIHPFSSIPQMTTPTPVPTTEPTNSSILDLLDFASLFGFDQRVSALEKDLSQVKQVDYSAQILAQIPILLDKLEKSKSYRAAEQHRDLYDALVKSYQVDKDLFDSYGKSYSLKRGREDKDKDEDPPAGSDQRLKKRKTSKDLEPSRGSKLKESKSISSKYFNYQSKSSGKSTQAEEPVFETAEIEMPQDQRDDMAYVLHNLKIENLTQEHLVGPAFNLLKWTCKRRVELEFHFEECYKAVIDKLDWHNPEGHEYPFDLSKSLPLIEDQGHQVVPANYFFNNDLEYLKVGSSSGKYTTSITKTKAGKYVNIERIEDMVQTLCCPVKVTYDKHAVWGTFHWV
nr:hypothetical protein [Tanacetum cinerariifolium]